MGALASAGARVAGLDLPRRPVTEAVQELLDHHGPERVALEEADVTSRTSLEAALEWCTHALGRPSILVNNAGIDQPPAEGAPTHAIEELPLEAWRPVMEVNLLGAFLSSQVFGAPMLEAGHGSIINIGSLYASVAPDYRYYDHIGSGRPFLKPPAYGASKAALVNLTRYLATLWATRGVRVNALSPGGVLGEQDPEFRRKFTARVPLGRMAEPADLGGPLVFLASDASRYVTGIELLADGGYTAW
jgi:NAD(P)-dependent dehydrogenase (short-subunit alcohol dehydrogenase family)